MNEISDEIICEEGNCNWHNSMEFIRDVMIPTSSIIDPTQVSVDILLGVPVMLHVAILSHQSFIFVCQFKRSLNGHLHDSRLSKSQQRLALFTDA